jgi:hypothetical protein
MSDLDIELRPTAIDPRTGEAITLEDLALQEREKQLRIWRTAVEDELVHRADDLRTDIVGNHQVDIDRGHTRKWDPEDLIETVSHLVGEGLLTVMDAQGLVRDVPKVDGVKAADLLKRVDGEALLELRKCFTWETKGRARVKVTPVAQLEQ